VPPSPKRFESYVSGDGHALLNLRHATPPDIQLPSGLCCRRMTEARFAPFLRIAAGRQRD
jgi:hypothetical protein